MMVTRKVMFALFLTLFAAAIVNCDDDNGETRSPPPSNGGDDGDGQTGPPDTATGQIWVENETGEEMRVIAWTGSGSDPDWSSGWWRYPEIAAGYLAEDAPVGTVNIYAEAVSDGHPWGPYTITINENQDYFVYLYW